MFEQLRFGGARPRSFLGAVLQPALPRDPRRLPRQAAAAPSAAPTATARPRAALYPGACSRT